MRLLLKSSHASLATIPHFDRLLRKLRLKVDQQVINGNHSIELVIENIDDTNRQQIIKLSQECFNRSLIQAE